MGPCPDCSARLLHVYIVHTIVGIALIMEYGSGAQDLLSVGFVFKGTSRII